MGSISLSLILPVYNETTRLIPGLSAIIAFLERKRKTSKQFAYEIIMIDDGSRVPAADIITRSHLASTIRSLMKKKRFKGYRLGRNYGKGRAIATGVEHAKGEAIAFLDIDLSVPVATVTKAIRELNEADIVIGSRRAQGSVIAVHQPFLREIGGRIYTALSRTLFGLSFSDVTCGCKVYTREVAKDLFSRLSIDRWAFDTELLVLAKARGYRVKEVPVVWSDKKGSKVTKHDMVRALVDLGKIFWNALIGVYDKEKEPEDNRVGACDACGNSSWQFLFDHHHEWKVQRCRQCGLVQVMPRPSQEKIERLYKDDASHFTPYISQEAVHRAYFREKLSYLQKIFGKTGSIRLLDVGCLTGVLLEEACSMGMRAEGVDISRDAVSHCKAKGLMIYHGDVETMRKKYPRKRYDAVTAFEIIEHAYSPRQMMTAIYKILKPGGVVLLTTPNHGSFWRTLMGKLWPGYTHPEHLYFFDPSSLHALLASCGFRDIRITRGDSRPFPLWYLFSRGADYFRSLRPLLYRLARLAKRFPLTNPVNPWDDLFAVARK